MDSRGERAHGSSCCGRDPKVLDEIPIHRLADRKRNTFDVERISVAPQIRVAPVAGLAKLVHEEANKLCH